jgi:hypothetical protein
MKDVYVIGIISNSGVACNCTEVLEDGCHACGDGYLIEPEPDDGGNQGPLDVLSSHCFLIFQLAAGLL